jgi:PleD family two-component response regulator
VYKNQRIQITFSAGVTFRNKYSNFEATQDIADKLLYKAKEQGRNKVFFDNGTEF